MGIHILGKTVFILKWDLGFEVHPVALNLVHIVHADGMAVEEGGGRFNTKTTFQAL